MHTRTSRAATIFAGLLVGAAAQPAAGVDLGNLEDCSTAVETFPARPCRDDLVPHATLREIRRVRVLLDDWAANVPDRALRAARHLRRADAAATEAEHAGRLPDGCAEVLHDQVRYAQACIARLLLEQRLRERE